MSNIYPIYTDRVRYKLTQNPTGQQIVEEPVGFRDDDNEFVRDKSFHGIFPQMTNSLTFYNDGRSFIRDVYNEYGINAEVILTKEERNPSTDVWEQVYTGFLDLTTYEQENEGVKIKFVSSGLLRVIKARQSEKIELDRLDTLQGNVIPYLEPSVVALNGRDIQLNSLLETGEEYDYTTATNVDSPGIKEFAMRHQSQQDYFGTMGYPMVVTYQSDISINQFVGGNLSMNEYVNAVETGREQSMFYAVSEKDTILDVKIKWSFNAFDAYTKYGIGGQKDIKELQNAQFFLRLAKYKDGVDYVFKEQIGSNLTPNMIFNNGVLQSEANQTGSLDLSINLLKGESVSLQFVGTATRWGQFIGIVGITHGNLRVSFKDMTGSIEIIRDSQFDATTSKIHFPFNVANRFLKLFTDKDNLVVSNVLGKIEDGYESDGEASLIAMAHGFWIRGFSKDDEPEINSETRYKSMTTSFKDFYESYFDVWNLGAGIEKVGFNETFRIEKLNYFYNKNILIRLGHVVNGKFEYLQVNKVKRSLKKDLFVSGLDIGYSKGGDYEEAVGLDEYNTRTTFTTVIDKVKSIYTAVAKFRADSYGAEFARRKQYDDFPTEDTKYDNSIWLLDLMRGTTKIFEQRLWQKDFSVEPTGVFSPDTAQNLRLSPFNILLRHGWFIGTGLVKYPLDFIRYGSSVANSGLVTKLKSIEYPQYGGIAHAENGNIQNQNLETARMDGEIIEFEFNVDYDLLQKVQGKTVILEKEVQNFYGLVSFMNEEGQIEEGYLEKLSPEGVGKWTLNKFNTI